MADGHRSPAAAYLRPYRAFFLASTNGIFVFDAEGTLLDVNHTACQLYGASREQMLALGSQDLIAPESRDVFDTFLDVVSKGEAFTGEARGLHRDGSLFDVKVEGHRIEVAANRFLVWSFVDITAQRHDEEEMRRDAEYRAFFADLSLKLLRADSKAIDGVIEASLAGISRIYDIDFCGFWWLDEAGQFMKSHLWTIEALADQVKAWPDPIPVDATAWAADRSASGEIVRIESLDDFPAEAEALRELNEELGIVSQVILPMFADDTRMGTFMLGTWRRSRRWSDRVVFELRAFGEVIASSLTRTRTLRALQESERNYRNIVEDQTEFIVRWKPDDGKRTFVNDAYCRAMGLPREELLGKTFLSRFRPEDRESILTALNQTRPENPVWTNVLSPILADGSVVWFQWTTRGLFDEAGNLLEFQSTGHDVTQQRRAEKALAHHVEYQTITAELSSSLLKAGSEVIDDTIAAAMARIGAFYDLEFVDFRWRDAQGRWTLSHHWGRIETHGRGRVLSEDDAAVSWPAQRMLRGEILRLESLRDLPPEAEALREFLEQFGIRSCILMPLLYRDDLVGSIQVGMYSRSRGWTEQDVSELQALGELVSAAYTRARARAALLEREAELAHSQKTAGVGSYFFFPKQGIASSSPEFDAIEGLELDSERTPEAWIRHLHPEDRERVLSTIANALERESEYVTEYRFIRDDGTVCCLEDRGEIERDEHGEVERVIGTVLDVTEQRKIEVELTRALNELQTLKRQLEVENVYLREEARLAHGSDFIVGKSAALQHCLRMVERVATTDVTVLIVGETGTGKELIARTIHELSGREGPLVTVNCAALPANLIESELFGHERGAFTDAKSRKPGRLELAERGTLFLDEIGELPLELQPKLLRVLQEGEFERVGGVETLTFDGRVIAATNRDLEEAVAHREFRPDLYFRLNVFPVRVPPLRERQEDIPLLTKHFVAMHAEGMNREVESISVRMLEHMVSRDWPGNIRELESFVQRALIVGDGPVLELGAQSAAPPDQPEQAPTGQGWRRLEEVEQAHVLRVLEESSWAVEGEQGAARRLGLAPSTLRSRMKKLGIRRQPDPSPPPGR